MRLMTPPLPAASRPSKIRTTRRPACLTQCCSFTSSSWSLASSRSYSLRFSLEGEASSFSRSTGAAPSSFTVHLSYPVSNFSAPCRSGDLCPAPHRSTQQTLVRGNLLRDRRQSSTAFWRWSTLVRVGEFALSSEAFQHGGEIPRRHSCEGE